MSTSAVRPPRIRANRKLEVALSALVLGTMLFGTASPGAQTEQYMTAGINYFKNHDYTHALAAFGNAYRANPANGNSVYYQGMCKQYMHDGKGAEALYATTILNYPGSGAATSAMSALNRLDPEYYNQIMRRGGGGSSSLGVSTMGGGANSAASTTRTYATAPSAPAGTYYSELIAPDMCRVPFRRDPQSVGGDMLVVDATINGRHQDMLFDTGASITAFGKNHLTELGIRAPSGAPTSFSHGVGSSEGIANWVMQVDLKVGPIERRNFPIHVQDNMGLYPLLGQTFFRDFQYTIDYTTAGKDRGTITFIKKGSSSASQQSGYSVPFRPEGNNMIVQVDVNGRTVPMFFDTGASGVVLTRAQCNELNIKIPEDATPMMAGGVGGQTPAVSFNVARIRCGPIDKSNVTIMVVDSASMSHPLLGQSYFGDWQYTIDNQNQVIHFLRR